MFSSYEEPSLGKTAKTVAITIAITAITNHLVAWAVEELKNKFSSKAKEAKSPKPEITPEAKDAKETRANNDHRSNSKTYS